MNTEALYDNPTSGIAQPEKKQEAPADKPAAFDPSRLYDTKHSDTPERKDERQPAQKTDEDRAAVLYSPDSTYADAVLVADVPGNATAEQVAAANADARAQFAAMELPGVLARTLTDRFTAVLQVEAAVRRAR